MRRCPRSAAASAGNIIRPSFIPFARWRNCAKRTRISTARSAISSRRSNRGLSFQQPQLWTAVENCRGCQRSRSPIEKVLLKSRFSHRLNSSKISSNSSSILFNSPSFLYTFSFSNLFPLLQGIALQTSAFRGQHSHGTCRPEERPAARTATFSGHRREKKHHSHPGQRVDGSQRRRGALSGHRSRSWIAKQMQCIGRQERIAHASGQEVLRDHQ